MQEEQDNPFEALELPTPELEHMYTFHFVDGPVVPAMGVGNGDIQVERAIVQVFPNEEPFYRIIVMGYKLLKNGMRDPRTRGANYYSRSELDEQFEQVFRAAYPDVLPS